MYGFICVLLILTFYCRYNIHGYQLTHKGGKVGVIKPMQRIAINKFKSKEDDPSEEEHVAMQNFLLGEDLGHIEYVFFFFFFFVCLLTNLCKHSNMIRYQHVLDHEHKDCTHLALKYACAEGLMNPNAR